MLIQSDQFQGRCDEQVVVLCGLFLFPRVPPEPQLPLVAELFEGNTVVADRGWRRTG